VQRTYHRGSCAIDGLARPRLPGPAATMTGMSRCAPAAGDDGTAGPGRRATCSSLERAVGKVPHRAASPGLAGQHLAGIVARLDRDRSVDGVAIPASDIDADRAERVALDRPDLRAGLPLGVAIADLGGADRRARELEELDRPRDRRAQDLGVVDMPETTSTRPRTVAGERPRPSASRIAARSSGASDRTTRDPPKPAAPGRPGMRRRRSRW
jgi:hypothetical protein